MNSLVFVKASEREQLADKGHASKASPSSLSARVNNLHTGVISLLFCETFQPHRPGNGASLINKVLLNAHVEAPTDSVVKF